MKSVVLSQFDMTYLPVIACLIFVTLFICMLFWINRPGAKKLYKQIAKLPMDNGDRYE